MSFEIEELRPRRAIEDAATSRESDAVQYDVLVNLRRVGPQLQGEYGRTTRHAAIPHADVPDRGRFAATRDESVAVPALDVFHHDIFHRRAVLIPIRERTLAAFECNIVVVG